MPPHPATHSPNLATGTLGAMGSAGGYYSQTTAGADFSDLLHYTVLGADSSTLTDIGVTFAIDGSMLEGGFGSPKLSAAST